MIISLIVVGGLFVFCCVAWYQDWKIQKTFWGKDEKRRTRKKDTETRDSNV